MISLNYGRVFCLESQKKNGTYQRYNHYFRQILFLIIYKYFKFSVPSIFLRLKAENTAITEAGHVYIFCVCACVCTQLICAQIFIAYKPLYMQTIFYIHFLLLAIVDKLLVNYSYCKLEKIL